MREERLLIAGGSELREVTVEEELTAGVRAELVLAFGVDNNAGVVTVVSGGSKVLLREGSALSTGVNSMDVVSSDDSESMSSAILASSSMMAATFLASASLLSASVLRDSSLMVSLSCSSSTSRLLRSSRCFLSNFSIFISASTFRWFSSAARARASRAFSASNLSACVLELERLFEEQRLHDPLELRRLGFVNSYKSCITRSFNSVAALQINSSTDAARFILCWARMLNCSEIWPCSVTSTHSISLSCCKTKFFHRASYRSNFSLTNVTHGGVLSRQSTSISLRAWVSELT